MASDPGTVTLDEIGRRIRPVVLAGEKVLPVPDAVRAVLPMGGLVKGASLSVAGAGATSLALVTLSTTSQRGSWIAFVGIDSLGWGAAARCGLDLTRTVAINSPPISRWATVTAALVDAFDVVVVDPLHQVAAPDARRLGARLRERGSVLMSIRPVDGRRRFAWPVPHDLSLTVDAPRWSGLGEGSGHLVERVVSVSSSGRRSADRLRRVELRVSVDGSDLVVVAPLDAAPRLRRVV